MRRTVTPPEEDRSSEASSMLEIAPEKVAYIIFKARAYDVQVPPVLPEDASGSDGKPDDVLASLPGSSARAELVAFINGLNVDEQAHLVALAWVGRGTFEPDEFEDAVATARGEHINSTASYLLGTPLLANYLEDGLEKLGYSVEDIESELP